MASKGKASLMLRLAAVDKNPAPQKGGVFL